MKKNALCIILAILISTFVSLDVFAADSEDSLKISNDITDAITNSADDVVIRLYNNRYIKRFAERQTISEQIEAVCKYNMEVFMVIEPSGSITYKKRWQDGFSNITARPYSDWSEFYIYAKYPNLIFDSTVEVTNVYCLDGTPSHEHVYIYYATNEGDYVLFKESLNDEKMYLLPLNDFYDFADAVWSEQKKYLDYEGGGGETIHELYDLEPYEFTPKDNSRTYMLIVAITAIVLLCGVTIYVLGKKRKNKV